MMDIYLETARDVRSHLKKDRVLKNYIKVKRNLKLKKSDNYAENKGFTSQYIVVGSTGSFGIELWIEPERFEPFWVGFVSSKKTPADEFENKCALLSVFDFTPEHDEENEEYFFGIRFSELRLNACIAALRKLINILHDQPISPDIGYSEGASKQVTRNVYERDPDARRKAIEIHGCKCKVCDMEFSKVYGEDLGREFIHVHHLYELHKGQRPTEPARDLIPVCPNCHTMLHKQDDCSEWERLRKTVFDRVSNRSGGL